MTDGQLTSTIDIILMSIQHFLPTRDAGGKTSALCLVLLIKCCLSIRALVELKHAQEVKCLEL